LHSRLELDISEYWKHVAEYNKFLETQKKQQEQIDQLAIIQNKI
jgi:hypothetical protein